MAWEGAATAEAAARRGERRRGEGGEVILDELPTLIRSGLDTRARGPPAAPAPPPEGLPATPPHPALPLDHAARSPPASQANHWPIEQKETAEQVLDTSIREASPSPLLGLAGLSLVALPHEAEAVERGAGCRGWRRLVPLRGIGKLPSRLLQRFARLQSWHVSSGLLAVCSGLGPGGGPTCSPHALYLMALRLSLHRASERRSEATRTRNVGSCSSLGYTCLLADSARQLRPRVSDAVRPHVHEGRAHLERRCMSARIARRRHSTAPPSVGGAFVRGGPRTNGTHPTVYNE